jgi:serine/threonine-protein kinase
MPESSEGAELSGQLLGQRYRVEKELGQGGFGRTYLAQDTHRFDEPCVLKEFAPLVQGEQALRKAEELFEREAGVLYQLQHPQIPKFRELFRAMAGDRARLFLVQDYVEGRTYRSLLNARKATGQFFSEFEVLQLLTQLLPVLDYIHQAGVIHRDISPDNLMLRFEDQLPVLIDFGGVKQVAAIASQYVSPQAMAAPSTRLGKVGYSPHEQMERGNAYPHSDLYALAATCLVLLTGKEPQTLLADNAPDWSTRVHLSPAFTQVLQRMLSITPRDRYPSAMHVLDALHGQSSAPPAPSANYTAPPPTHAPSYSTPEPTGATIAAGPANDTPAPPTPPIAPSRKSGFGGWIALLIVVLAAGGGGWWAVNEFLAPETPDTNEEPEAVEPEAVEPDEPEVSSNLPPEEQARKEALGERRRELGVNYELLVRLTNRTFFEEYPGQQGRTLTESPDDAVWRERWDAIASDWLDMLETNLSSAARQNLGSYTAGDRDRWKQRVNQLFVGSRALNDLADAQFFQLFPDQRDEDFINEPIGQVWHAIAFDTVNALENGTILEEIRFEDGSYSTRLTPTLNPGSGQVYIGNFSENQILRLNLQASANGTRLSVYLPRPTDQQASLLEDSEKTTWSGRLPQSGYYEIVIVSTAEEPLSTTLNLSVDNVTTETIEPPAEDVPNGAPKN